MGEAENEGVTRDNTVQATKRLREIWVEWGLEPDDVIGGLQVAALAPVAAWIRGSVKEPERIIRVVQMLLCDPETPGTHRRGCWSTLNDAVAPKWTTVGTRQTDIHFMQALLLASLEHSTLSSRLKTVAGLLRGALEVYPRQIRRTEGLRGAVFSNEVFAKTVDRTESRIFPHIPLPTFDPSSRISALAPNISGLDTALQQNQGTSNWRPHLMAIIGAFQNSLLDLKGIGEEANASIGQNVASIKEFVQDTVLGIQPAIAQGDLLWWGQARYSQALRKPYRRFEKAADVAFWAPFEAASLAHKANADIEPAAAYVVEVLHALGHDITEQKTLRDWMASLLKTLRDAGQKAPTLGPALSNVAREDALGMPVTWVRLQAAGAGNLEGADEAVALPLDETIDLGEWASWIFRESLLDLHLAQGTTP